eukprot:3386276-Pyramimonas_sp.AAC.1
MKQDEPESVPTKLLGMEQMLAQRHKSYERPVDQEQQLKLGEWKECIENKVASRSKQYQAFMAEMGSDPEMKKKFDKCQTRDEKAAFRIDWANNKLIEYEK